MLLSCTYPTWTDILTSPIWILYPYSLSLTDENLPSSATVLRYSIDAYMNCVDACYQTLKHKMNGRRGPALNCVDPPFDVCFQAKDTGWHRSSCFFFNISLTHALCWFKILGGDFLRIPSCNSGKPRFATSDPTRPGRCWASLTTTSSTQADAQGGTVASD